jgi:mono/diheme cytochrome c family protein
MRASACIPGGMTPAALAGALLGVALAAGCQQSDVPRPTGQQQQQPATAVASPTAPAAQTAAASPAAPPAGAAPAGGGQTAQAPAGGQVPSSPESIQRGKQLFTQNCATCHGESGKGDGPAAAALNPKPQNLTDNEWKHGGEPQQIFQTVTNGVPGTAMVGWATIPEQGRWDLVNYVRSLSGQK